MARRKKGAVGKGRGATCCICGKNCGKGGALKKHIEGIHDLEYAKYKMCFEGHANEVKVVFSAWNETFQTISGKNVVLHILVRSFVRSIGKRGVSKMITRKSSGPVQSSTELTGNHVLSE